MSRSIAHSRKDQPNRPASSARLVVACMALFCIVVTIAAQQPGETDAAKKQPAPDSGGSKLETLAVAQGKVAEAEAQFQRVLTARPGAAGAALGMGKIHFLSDWNAAFTKALGMDIDLSAGTLGVRSKRYSMLVENGVVKTLNVEENPGQATVSAAAAMLDQI